MGINKSRLLLLLLIGTFILLANNVALAATITFHTDGNGKIEFNGTAYSDGETVDVANGTYTIKALPEEENGWEFEYWTADVSGVEPIKNIDVDSDMGITANFIRKKPSDYIDFGSITMQPTDNMVVNQVGGTEYDVRPDALLGLDYVDNVRIRFNVLESPFEKFNQPDEEYIRIFTSDGTLARTLGSIVTWDPDASGNFGTIKITQTGLGNLYDQFITKTFKVQVYTPAGYVELVTMNLKSAIEPPIIDVELMDYLEEFGTLIPNKVYYIPEGEDPTKKNDIGDLRIRAGNVQTELNPKEFRVSGQGHSDGSGVEETTENIIPMSDYSWLTNLNQIDDSLDTDLGSEWEIESTPLDNVNISQGFLAVKLEVTAEGQDLSQELNRPVYYFVNDNDKPEIQVINASGTEDETSFDTFSTRRPQLKARIFDEISGIESGEDVTIKYRPLRVGESKENLKTVANVNFGDEDSGVERMDVISLSEHNDGEQTAIFVPYRELDEGEYVVKITAEDQAGNSSEDNENAPFVFYLNIDQTGATINNVSVNNRTIDTTTTEEQPVSANSLELYFEAYGIEDLIYGIRHEGDSQWFITNLTDVSYITQYERVDFLNHTGISDNPYNDNGAAKNGVYEIFIIADEEGIPDNDMAELEIALNNNEYGFIEDSSIIDDSLDEFDSGSIIGNLIYQAEQASSADDTLRVGRRTYVTFKVEVDGNPPEYQADSLYYYKSYPNERNVLDDSGEDTTKIYQGQPVFEMTLVNASEINRNDIEITFFNQDNNQILAGDVIVPPIVSEDSDGNTIHTIYFQPVIALTNGVYTLEVKASDEFGNTTVEDQILFADLFEIISSSEGRLQFSITDGERLNINQSSALEINITETNLNPSEYLRIEVNGAVIVEDGQIVDDRSLASDDDNRYRDENYLDTATADKDQYYYESSNYQADGFDVLFFNNKRRIIIFSRLPLPSGRNEVEVEVIDEQTRTIVTDSVEFMVDNYRQGFGFGRLLVD